MSAKKSMTTLAAAIAAALPLAAYAEGGFYVGAGLGLGTYESSDFVDCFGTCETFSDSDLAWGLYAGWQVSKAVGVELGYWDWGEGEDTVYGDKVTVEPSMFTVMAVGTVPIAESFSLFGKAGVAFLSIDSSVDGGEGGSGSSDSEDLALGGGVQWNTGNFGVRGEALWVDAEDADKSMMFTISGLYRFGG
jgi:OOP family OmpA-OmpF porin